MGESGLGHALLVDGVNLSNDIGAVARIGGGPAALDLTGIDKFAHERQGGPRDGSIEASAWMNPTGAHTVLSTLPTGDRVVSYLAGIAHGRPAASLVGKQPNYDPTRNQDASLSYAWATQGNGFGLEWGQLATAGLAAHAGPASEAGLDAGAGTAVGLQAYLQLLDLTGTDITVVVEHSDDDGAADPYTTLVSFAQATTAPGAQRVQTARDATVKRWLRVSSTGAFTGATLAVVLVRNQVAVDF